jgi:hypothetical protein
MRLPDRVVFINDDCVESSGGAAIALASMRQLRQHSSPVTFITGDRGGNDELAAPGVDIASLGGHQPIDGYRADPTEVATPIQADSYPALIWLGAEPTLTTIALK